MRVDCNSTGHALALTPWMTGTPARVGWYIASAERNPAMRAFFNGSSWSAQVDEAAPGTAFDAARATPMCSARARSLEWRGVSRAAHDALQAEMAAEMNRD